MLAAMTPDATGFVDSVEQSFGSSPPAAGVNEDYFASRYTWYMPLQETLNYTFYLSVDDTVSAHGDAISPKPSLLLTTTPSYPPHPLTHRAAPTQGSLPPQGFHFPAYRVFIPCMFIPCL